MNTEEANCIACDRSFLVPVGEVKICGICTEKHPELPEELIKKGRKYDQAKKVLKLIWAKDRDGEIEMDEGSEAYDELAKLMSDGE